MNKENAVLEQDIVNAWKKHVMATYLEMLSTDEETSNISFNKFLKAYSTDSEIATWLNSFVISIKNAVGS